VKPDSDYPTLIIHLDCILRGVHLIGVAGQDFIPKDLTYHNSLDAFQSFYISKYADYHSHEIVF
jgi:hypothetical protein